MPTCAGLPAAAFIDACLPAGLADRPATIRALIPLRHRTEGFCDARFRRSRNLLIAFLINATSTATSAVFAPMSLLLVGLICLALHLSGVGTGWSVPGRRTRR
jgi:hypothetical protein